MEITRREALKTIGRGTLVLAGGNIITSVMIRDNLAYASEDEKWKQFAGSKLIFVSEDTPPTLAIKSQIHKFKELTGIEVEIIPDYIDVVRKRVETEAKEKRGDFTLFYSQDNPIGAPFFHLTEDLRVFEKDPTLPKVRDGVGDDVWEYRWLDVTGRFYGYDKIAAYPYDNAINVMMYRKDIFEKYSKQYEGEFGKPLEYSDESTWKDVMDICNFFKKAKLPDVRYGIALWGKLGWPLFADFQRFSYSHGQWTEWNFDPYTGSEKPGPCNWGDEQSVLSMTRYKELTEYAHPESFRYYWDTVNKAYISGVVAMMVNVGEYAGVVENPKVSKAAGGRTAYGFCPKGEPSWIVNKGKAVHGTNYGIGGIAVSNTAKPELKKAAYLFVLWSTSHDTQYMVFKEAGGTPTRKSVFQLPEVQAAFHRKTAPMKNIDPVETDAGVRVDKMPQMPVALTYPYSLKAVRPPDVVLGPKIPTFNEYIRVMSSEIQKCTGGMQSPEDTCGIIKKKTDELHGIKS